MPGLKENAMAQDPETFAMILDMVRRFVADRLIPAEAEVAETDRIPSAIIEEMRELGLFGLSIGPEFGGLGLNMEEEVRVVFELGRTSPAFRSVVGTNIGIGSQAIVFAGSDQQKSRYLPELAAGRIIGSFALTEPDAGSDALSLRTAAVRDGDHYVLNGTKRYITNAPQAGLFTVMARTSPEKRADSVSCFLVEAGTPGLSLGKPDKKMGQAGAATCDVIFENCRVPASALLGGAEGNGFRTAMKVLDKGRLHIAALCTGIANRLIEEAVRFAVESREVPELRIVDDALWDAVKTRQAVVRPEKQSTGGNALNGAHRQRFLLSGLMRCGSCGGGYTIIGKDRYGCATRRQKGTCDNLRTITRQEIEARVLDGLKERLLSPELVAEFMTAFREEVAREREERKAGERGREKKRAELDRKIVGLMQAIEDGLYDTAMKERMRELRAERIALGTEPEGTFAPELDVLIHPRLPDLYRRKVAELERVLDGPDREEAMELIRSMIDRVVLTPRACGSRLDAVLYGDLAAILSACDGAQNGKRPTACEPAGRQLSVVAGTRSHLYRTKLNTGSVPG
jgi:acyl-CoA dehydrogenase